VKLIGAGFPRTATLSQKIALEMLGVGPCYHMVNVLGDLSQTQPWHRALDGESPWHEIFDGFESTVDWPGGFFYKEILEAFPDAKVLLSVRDPEAWERSMRGTVWDVRHGNSVMRHVSDAWGLIDSQWAEYLRMVDRMLWTDNGSFAGGNDTPEEMLAGMERHHEEVKSTVPSEKLLVWSASEGWEPLCEFLEVPVPDAPFPRVNDSATFVDRVVDQALLALNAWRARSQAEQAEPAATH
jgi:hypothetical protein